MDRKNIISLAIICILFVSLIAFISYTNFTENNKEQEPFYIGVSFGGNNVQDAETLIDKVANYTNLFVLQSGLLKGDASAVNEIGDYAVSRGLHFAAYFDVLSPAQNALWIGSAKHRWGDMFVGVYFGDEPGGKLLDGGTTTFTLSTNKSINISTDGTITYYDTLHYYATYYPNGDIIVTKTNGTLVFIPNPDDKTITIEHELFNATTYNTNGSITFHEILIQTTVKGNVPSSRVLSENYYTRENGSDYIAQLETYQQVKSKNPIPDYDAAANLYINKTKGPIDNLRNQWNISGGDFPVFTSDYGLYWWDYQSGYDMVLSQLGWNNTVAQEIALVRGAANLQGKNWGTILTWKYTQAPYLADGHEIFNQMKTSYENGAQYVILFNYAESMSGPYGILQEEHFQALERFWNNVVQNTSVVHGGIKAEAALVLPRDYGWGMRHPQDTIWGLWNANGTSQQIWNQVQSKLTQYGSKLDIVYEDPAYPITDRYSQIYYWNQ
jgi:hypothetical protein